MKKRIKVRTNGGLKRIVILFTLQLLLHIASIVLRTHRYIIKTGDGLLTLAQLGQGNIGFFKFLIGIHLDKEERGNFF